MRNALDGTNCVKKAFINSFTGVGTREDDSINHWDALYVPVAFVFPEVLLILTDLERMEWITRTGRLRMMWKWQYDKTVWLSELKMLREGRLQYVDRMSTCMTLKNGPLNMLNLDSDLYVSNKSTCTRTDMIPYWIPWSEFQSLAARFPWQPQSRGKADADLFRLSFWHDQLFQHLLQSGLNSLTSWNWASVASK